MKNRKLLLIVSVVLALTMSLGGTLAYLTDTDADVNTMVLGNVKIEQLEYERVPDGNGGYEKLDDESGYKLQLFTQDKPLLPATGAVSGTPDNDWDDVVVPFDQIGGAGNMQVLDGVNNIQDKFVVVKNTGNTNAYVRTFIAYEAGSYDLAKWDELVMTCNHVFWDDPICHDVVSINGNNYVVVEYVYSKVLGAGEVSRNSLSQIYLMPEATNEDLIALDGNKNGTYDILVLSQAIQADGFADAATALTAGFGAATELNAEGKMNVVAWFEGNDEIEAADLPFVVTNAEELAAAVAAGKTNIALADGEYNVANCGGKTLTITGSKNAVIKLYNEGENGADYGFDASTVTFNGVTIDTSANTGSYKGFARMNATFNDCTFKGAYTSFQNNVFNNCDFDFQNGYFWTWGADELTFNNCTFGGNSKCILAHGSASTVITIKDCNFTATEKGYTGSGDHTAVVEIDPTGANTYTINFSGNNIKTTSYAGWTRVKDNSTGHTITGLN